MRCLAMAVVLGSTVVLGQGSPTFEVASVRPTPESVEPGAGGVRIAGAQARFTAVPLKQYITWAYQVRQQHVIGPDWLHQPKFDLIANLPAGAPVAQVPAMLRAFLVDRFQMTAHSETRLLPTYALAVAKDGLKIQPAEALPETPDARLPEVDAASRATGAGYQVELGRGSSFVVGTNRIEFTRTTMSTLAEMLSSLTDRPVLDETGLTDLFNVTLDIEPDDYGALRAQGAANAGVTLSPEGYRMLAEAKPGALSRALQKSGLTLEARTGPVEVVVVDSIAKAPTAN